MSPEAPTPAVQHGMVVHLSPLWQNIVLQQRTQKNVPGKTFFPPPVSRK